MSDYNINKLAIIQEKEQRVSLAIQEIENKPIVSSLVFVKSIPALKKIRDRKTEIDIQLTVWLMMVKISGYAGVKKEITDFDKTDILKMVFTSYSDLTLEEIWKAFELERFGEYPEKTKHFDLFNADYVSEIFKKYRVWRQQIRIANNVPLSIEESSTSELSPEQKEEKAKQGVLRVFSEYKENRELPTPNFWIFDYLWEKGILNKNTPEKEKKFAEIWVKAESQVKAELSAKKALSREEKRVINFDLEAIVNGKSNLVLIRSKKIAIEYFFNDLIINNKNLEL